MHPDRRHGAFIVPKASLFHIHRHFIDEYEGEDKIAAMQHLLVAADRYGLNRLRLICEEKLSSWIDVQSVATTLVLADEYQCVQLKDACLDSMAWRDVLGPVMKTDGFKHLAASCPLIMAEILDKIASAKIE